MLEPKRGKFYDVDVLEPVTKKMLCSLHQRFALPVLRKALETTGTRLVFTQGIWNYGEKATTIKMKLLPNTTGDHCAPS